MSSYVGYTATQFMIIFLIGVGLCWLSQFFIETEELKKNTPYPKLRPLIFMVVSVVVAVISLIQKIDFSIVLLSHIAACLGACLIDYISHKHSQEMQS